MFAWGLLVGVLGYLAGALLTARAAYGLQRARIIEQEARWHQDGDPVERFERNDQSSAATAAFLFGLAWPLTVPSSCVSRLAAFIITSNPPPAGPERDRAPEQLQRRIRELEESLHMVPTPRPQEQGEG